MGRVIHFEIHVTDVARAIAFYETVMGWRIRPWNGESDGYWLIETGEHGTAGIDGALMLRHGPAPVDGQPLTGFMCTAEVADVDGVTAAAEKAGGRVALAKRPIPGVGWHACIHDSEGNILGLLQPDPAAASG
ncbi:MAG: VOC family protein [Alphaproteobacteria bacterium]